MKQNLGHTSFRLVMIQEGEGCDYTIGCGIRVEPLLAASTSEALTEAERKIKGGDEGSQMLEGEYALSRAFVVSAYIDLPLDVWREERRLSKMRQKDRDAEAAERALLAKLQSKYVTRPVVYIHLETEMDGERESAAKYLLTVDSRMKIPEGSTVIARYGLLPHYAEWERDLGHLDARLLNSYAQHCWIAGLTPWAGSVNHGIEGVLEGLTPKTWTSRWDLLPEGSYVVKGRVNSLKQDWNTKMFAPTKEDVPRIAAALLGDSLIRDQGVVVREYIPLKRLDTGLNELPITNEWRTFWVTAPSGPVFLASGYYWQYSHPEAGERARWSKEAYEVAEKAAALVSEHVNFFVLDVAETEEGNWIVIEVNDAQMSGLCGCSARRLYQELACALETNDREV